MSTTPWTVMGSTSVIPVSTDRQRMIGAGIIEPTCNWSDAVLKAAKRVDGDPCKGCLLECRRNS